MSTSDAGDSIPADQVPSEHDSPGEPDTVPPARTEGD
jgi:hypothetical protein